MDPKESPRAKSWGKFFDVIMLLVMFWLPMQWIAEYRGNLTPEFIYHANWTVWWLFLIEAVVMTSIVKNKWYYLQTNWLNLLILVLVFPPFQDYNNSYWALLRYARLLVMLRLILPQLVNLHRILSRNSFGATLLAFLIVTLLSGILISYIDPRMGSPWEGIWWAWQTVTTVGYGDVVPDTVMGKIFAALLMLIGVGLFSLVSANLAAYFIERGRRQKEKKPEKQLQKQFRDINDRLDKIEDSHKRFEDLLFRILAHHSNSSNNERTDQE